MYGHFEIKYDLNPVSGIRNTISTIKDIMKFFRESILRRKYAPNIPTFCETRWSQKYKSIGIFKKNFEMLIVGLDTLKKEGNAATRSSAFQLHSAATKSQFIICVFIKAQYSALLVPVVNAMQSKSIDLFVCVKHIQKILTILKSHREKSHEIIKEIMDDIDI